MEFSIVGRRGSQYSKELLHLALLSVTSLVLADSFAQVAPQTQKSIVTGLDPS